MAFNNNLEVLKLLAASASAARDYKAAFGPAQVAPGVFPAGEGLAHDELFTGGVLEQFDSFFGDIVELGEYRFIGYPALALLQQDGLIQAFVETIVEELGRKWVILEGERASESEEAINGKFKLRKRFDAAASASGYQGGALLYIDLGVKDEEKAMPLSLDSAKIPKGSLRGFKLVEPYYVAPTGYQTVDPLADDFFKPTHWYVGGRKVHASRFLYFSWNTPLSIIRPAYNFFGIPLPQLLLKYIKGFEQSREAGMQLIQNFSLLGLKTDLAQLLQPGGVDGESTNGLEALQTRIQAFLAMRSRKGMAVVDSTEELFEINTPLSGMEGLISQQFELPALVSRLPISKAFGTPPRGFSATGESDEENFDDRMASIQNRLFRDNYSTARAVIELSEFSQRVSDLKEEWESFEEPNTSELAQNNLINAQANAIYVQSGVASTYEVRKQIGDDPNSGFNGFDAASVPPQPIGMVDASLMQPQAQSPADAAKAAVGKVLEAMQQKAGANG